MTKGRAIPYSQEELMWLEANRLLPIREYQAAFCETFGRTDVEPGHLNSLRKRMGWPTGRSGRFEKGQVPANKGKPMPFHPNSAATRFKKGQLSGKAAELVKPIGTERLSKEGYLERKIHNGLPMQSRWKAVHRIRWEEANGPVPVGHALKCLDGDRRNTDPTNWRAIPRGLLPRLAGGRHKTKLPYDQAAPELKATILAVAELQHRSGSIRRAK